MPKQSTETLKPPVDGGRLMNSFSFEGVGGLNYVLKKNWRREYNTEARREGDILFIPEKIEDSIPDTINGDPVTFWHFAQAPNGQVILLTFTKKFIFRYFTLLGGLVYDEDVYEDDVFENNLSSWININPLGYEFSESGHRWEAETVNGITFMNNGVDLPVTFCAFEDKARPVFELREQCIARVETIMKFNGIILCLDCTGIAKAKFQDVMNGDEPYGLHSDPDTDQERQWRVINGKQNDPRLWGTTGKASITAGSTNLTLLTTMTSVKTGDLVLIEGAGPGESNKTTLITSKLDDLNYVIDSPADTTVVERNIQRCENLLTGPMTTFYDLQDGGSAIIRGMEINKKTFIIHKDEGYYLGVYTGNKEQPFQFEHKYEGRSTIHYRWSLKKITTEQGTFHLYAGKNAFYVVNGSGDPQEFLPFAACKRLFFQNVTKDRDNAFAEINDVTEEYWLRFDSKDPEVKILIYSMRWDDVNTSDRDYTSFKTIRSQVDQIDGISQDWFVAGYPDGQVVIYALTDEPDEILNERVSFFGTKGRLTRGISLIKEGKFVKADEDFFLPTDEGKFLFTSKNDREYSVATITKFHSATHVETDEEIVTDDPIQGGVFEGYADSMMMDGYESFVAKTRGKSTAEEDEILMVGLTVLMGTEDRGAPITVEMFGAKNPNDETLLKKESLFERVVDDPGQNFIPTNFQRNYFQTKISVINSLLDARFSSKVYRIKRILGSDSITRGR